MHILAVTLAAGLAFTSCAHAQDLTLDDVIDRHVEARGGAAAIESVQSIIVDLHIEEQEFAVTGRYYANREGNMRVNIYMEGERVFTEAMGPDGGWAMGGGATVGSGITELEEDILTRGIHGNLYGLHELEGLGYEVGLGEREEIDGTNYYIINTTAPSGFDKRFYLNPETFQIERQREHSALHPTLDPEAHPNEQVNSDFRFVGGVTRSHRSQKWELDTGEWVQTTTVQGVVINPEIDATIFERPE